VAKIIFCVLGALAIDKNISSRLIGKHSKCRLCAFITVLQIRNPSLGICHRYKLLPCKGDVVEDRRGLLTYFTLNNILFCLLSVISRENIISIPLPAFSTLQLIFSFPSFMDIFSLNGIANCNFLSFILP